MNQTEHQMIGVLHGSLMVHELIHQDDLSKQQEGKGKQERGEEETGQCNDEVIHSPDIRQENKQMTMEAPCFKLFSWIHL